MIKIYVLYDLYVDANARQSGVARALLQRAKLQATEQGVGRIDLQTAQDNVTAQKLYKSFGYQYSDDYQDWSYYLIS